MINLKAVKFMYKTEDYLVPVLDNCTIKIEKGDRIAIWGSSGSGKSTLLSLIGNVNSPIDGTITYSIPNIRREIAWVTQEQILLNDLTIKENIQLIANGRNMNLDNSNYEYLMEYFEMRKFENDFPKKLSSGEKQRICIIRALLSNSSIVILDEPTASLDVKNKEKVMDILFDYAVRKSITLIIATHDEIFNKYPFSHYILNDGKLELRE